MRTIKELKKIISENSKYISGMQENIDRGYEVEASQECMGILFKEMVEAKRELADIGIVAI